MPGKKLQIRGVHLKLENVLKSIQILMWYCFFYFFLSRKLVRPILGTLPLRGIFEDWSEQTSSRDEMATIRFVVGSAARKPKTQQPGMSEIPTNACQPTSIAHKTGRKVLDKRNFSWLNFENKLLSLINLLLCKSNVLNQPNQKESLQWRWNEAKKSCWCSIQKKTKQCRLRFFVTNDALKGCFSHQKVLGKHFPP